MSTLTSLISAGGGGGGGETHIVTDPKKLHRTLFGRAFIPGNTESRVSQFYTYPASSTNMAATVQTASSDTYVTLLNASNADGGYLHFVVSPGINTAGQSASVRITVDGGTPVEITYVASALTGTSQNRMFLGGGLTNSPRTADMWSGNNTDISWGSYSKNMEDATNNVYSIMSSVSTFDGYIQCDLSVLRDMPFQRLYFTSSLLVEVKHSSYSTSNAADRALCFYSLI